MNKLNIVLVSLLAFLPFNLMAKDDIFQKMTAELVKAKSFEYTGEIKATGMSKAISIKGNFDLSKNKSQTLSTAQIEKIKGYIAQSKIFKVQNKLMDEKVGGLDAYHYKFSLDTKELMKLGKEVNKMEDYKKSLKILESLSAEIWINKKDLLPLKLWLKSSGFDISLNLKNYKK